MNPEYIPCCIINLTGRILTMVLCTFDCLLQLVDFRFSKKLTGDRTFTICGIADSLAPEIVLGKGHGFASDW